MTKNAEKYAYWTQSDILLLIECLNNNMTYKECSVKLNRTCRAIQQIVYRLKKKGKLEIKKAARQKAIKPEKPKQGESAKRRKGIVQRFGFFISRKELMKMSKEEKTKVCLQCPLPECVNCFGTVTEGRRYR